MNDLPSACSPRSAGSTRSLARTRLFWPRPLLAAGLCCAAVAWLAGPTGRLLVVLPLLLFGPGYLAVRALAVPLPTTAFVRPALWLGLSLSLVALLYEWATAVGLALTPPALGLLTMACGLAVVASLWRSPPTDCQGGAAMSGWWWLALLAVLALALWARFLQIAGLALPAWVDSIHHALLIRVAAEHGQAPYSLRPYLPVDQLTYHWGYHVFVAAILQLTGLPLGRAMLWVGQVLNALHVLTVAALAAYLWRRPLAGLVAGIVVGMISIMPAYYVSWGRYTQLTGLLVLPPLAIVWHAGLRTPSYRRALCTALMLAGLSLIHTRVLCFALGFMASAAAVWAVGQPRSHLCPHARHLALPVVLALGLAAPWLALLVTRWLAPALERRLDLAGGGDYNALNEGLLWAGNNRWLLGLALASALWGLRRRTRATVELIGWVAALVVLANPWLAGYLLPAAGASLALWGLQQRRVLAVLGGAALLLLGRLAARIPYLWLLTNDSVVISLFVPIGVLVGGGAWMASSWLLTIGRRESSVEHKEPSIENRVAIAQRAIIRRYGGGLLLALIALWGAWSGRSVINPVTVLATPADVEAIAWATQHTPSDARFLINASPWLNIYRGVDGGWWLLPLAGRWTSTPPVLYIYGPPDYVRETSELSRQVAGFQPGQEQQLYRLIQQAGITHIYLGPRTGPLTPATFMGNPAFETVYAHDGVTILAVHRQP